jgi:hypothetical protein
MAIRIKRSSGNAAPSSLASGQLAYSEGATNGGTLYYGELGGTVREIAGKKFVDKLNGIAAGAIANVVEDTTPQLGGSLDVNGQSIVSASNGNIAITPNGTGSVVLDGVNWPQADGTANQFLKTNGSGQLAYATITQANGNELENVVEDTTPQLGGNLDVNGQSIVSVSNGNITLAPNGTGKVVVSGDLQVDGVTTTINATNLNVADKNITVAKGAANAAAANGAGLTVEGPATQATILYASADDSWNFNKKTTATELQVDNININGNTIASTDTDGSITLTPNGTGDVQLLADTVLVGDSGAEAIITSNGSGGLRLSSNNNSTTGYIYIGGENSNLTLEPNGTGDVFLIADTVRIGDQNTAARLTTFGTGALQLSTNNGTDSGTITLSSGVNSNITIAPNGLGAIVLASPTIANINNSAGNSAIQARHSATASSTDSHHSIMAQKHRTDIALSSMTDEPAVYAFGVRDSSSTNRTFGRWIGRFAGTSTNPRFDLRGSADGFSTSVSYVSFGSSLGTFGNANSDYTVASNTGGALRLTANNNSSSGVITIASGADATISLVPNGVGKLLLNTVHWPLADGSANQVLKTDGAGQSGWVSLNSLVSDTNTTYAVSAETVTGGANLRLTGSDASTDDVKIAGGTNVTVTRTDGNTITISATDTGITDIVSDTTPQLGGNLDVNGNSIVSVSNGDITIAPNGTGDVQLQADIFVGRTNTDVQVSTNGTADLILNTNNASNSGSIRIYDGANGNIAITPDGTGSIVLDGLNWPQADGTADYVLKTNGSGQLSWVAQPTVISTFTGLSDTPANYTSAGSYHVRVNAGATALEFVQDIDDGTF